MGYRDELIRRVQEFGDWDKLPESFREILESVNEEAARLMLVAGDENETEYQEQLLALSRPESEESQQTVLEQVRKGLTNLAKVLQGRLLGDEGRLSELGQALAHLYRAAEVAGFTAAHVNFGLKEISYEGVLLVKLLSKRWND
jgi:hypothetical protein